MADQTSIGFPFQQAFERFLISPQTSWDRFFNPQLIISMNGDDAPVENHVLRKAGSYGKQLGTILDVLGVLVARLDEPALTPAEWRIVDRFHDLARRVDAAVADYRGPDPEAITASDVDRVAAGLRSLAHSDPATWRVLADRLRGAIDRTDGGGGQPAPR